MGRFDEIKNKINANINENGEQRITGQVLNEVLIDEVNTIDEAITELEESIGQGGGGGGSITLDSEMSDTSENAVSNKVIKEYVDSFIPSEFSEEFNDDFTN